MVLRTSHGFSWLAVDLDRPLAVQWLYNAKSCVAEPRYALEILDSGLVDTFTSHGMTVVCATSHLRDRAVR